MIRDDDISRYLKQEMSEAESLLFEAELNQNKELQEEVNFQREMFAFFKQRGDTTKLQTVLQQSENTFFETPTTRGKKFPFFYVFLGIITLMGIGYFFFSKTSDVNTTPPKNY